MMNLKYFALTLLLTPIYATVVLITAVVLTSALISGFAVAFLASPTTVYNTIKNHYEDREKLRRG